MEGRPRGFRPAPFRAPPHLLATASGNRSCRLRPDLIPRMFHLSARAARGCVASLSRDLIPRMFRRDLPAENTGEILAATTRGLESSLAASRPPGQPDGFVPEI
jgi:hypothetical protein